MALVNLVKMTTATVGTGTITLGSAVTGFLTMAQAGAVDGATYSYGIIDGANSEVGTGVYTATGTTLTRTVVNSTNSNAAISLSGTAKVYITPNTRDFDPVPVGDNSGTLYSTTLPSTPTEGVKLFAAKRANRRMLAWITPTGRFERVGPWLGNNNTVWYSPPYNTAQAISAAITTNAMGAQFAVAGVAATAKPYATTNFLTMQRGFQQTLAAATSIFEVSGPLMCSRNPGSNEGGFHAAWRFGIVALNTDAKMFCGMMSTATAATNVNPNTLFNIVGLGKVSTDTTVLKMFANGSSGTAQGITLTNTGTMTGIANTWWQVEIFCKSGDTQFGFRVTRTSSAGVETVDEGVITGTQGAAGGIPADTTAFAPHWWMANTTAVTLTGQFGQFFMDTD
jgi:hypothetical protein